MKHNEGSNLTQDYMVSLSHALWGMSLEKFSYKVFVSSVFLKKLERNEATDLAVSQLPPVEPGGPKSHRILTQTSWRFNLALKHHLLGNSNRLV